VVQVVSDSIKENAFHGAFDAWKKTMGLLYTFSRKGMAAKIE
jgi:hypothetical protein